MKTETVHGFQLPKLGLGTWSFGGDRASDRTPSAALRARTALRVALEIGYRHFDTAETYGDGRSEELLGEAIRESGLSRESLIITTKVAPEHLRYSAVRASCEASLRRLRLDYIDLYLIHWPGTGTDYVEAFRALNELVAEGKIRHLGVSNFGRDLLAQVRQLAASPIVTNQIPYSLSKRSYERNGVIEHCRENDMVVTAYSPLDQGAFRAGGELREIARRHRATPHQIALAWLIAKPRVITIPMSLDPAHLRENWNAQVIELAADEQASLNRL